MSATDPYTVYVGITEDMDSNNIFNKEFPGGIFKSVNGGDSWTRLNMPDNTDKNSFDRIMLWDDNTIFTSGAINHSTPGLGLIKSTDGGETWINLTPSGVLVNAFDVSAQDSNYIYIRDYSTYKIHISTDGANTWRSYSTGRQGEMRVSPHNKNTVIYVGYNSLHKSTDALVSSDYVVLNATASFADIEFSKSDPNIVYAAAGGYLVYKSTDAGESFSLKANLRDYIDSH